jgi:hypothetical protein
MHKCSERTARNEVTRGTHPILHRQKLKHIIIRGGRRWHESINRHQHVGVVGFLNLYASCSSRSSGLTLTQTILLLKLAAESIWQI